MLLQELRYDKAGLVDKIMFFVDEAAKGDVKFVQILHKAGIDVNQDPDEIRDQLYILDEFKIAQLYRKLSS